MYTLYYAPGSASMVVHLALLEDPVLVIQSTDREGVGALVSEAVQDRYDTVLPAKKIAGLIAQRPAPLGSKYFCKRSWDKPRPIARLSYSPANPRLPVNHRLGFHSRLPKRRPTSRACF